MNTLATLTPIEHALVSRHLKRLRCINSLQVRRDYLASIGRTESEERQRVVEACFAEEWEQRKAEGAPR